jgi:hypothetical protein
MYRVPPLALHSNGTSAIRRRASAKGREQAKETLELLFHLMAYPPDDS